MRSTLWDEAGGPLAETGRQAVALLLRGIAGEPVPERTPLLPVELIVRDSCGGRRKDRRAHV